MTCEELRSYISDRNTAGDQAATEHLETCADCRKLTFAQEQLGRCLQSVRESAPEIPTSLDAAVMSSYRRAVERKPVASGRRIFSTRLAWVAVAAVLVVGAVLLAAYRRTEMPVDRRVVQSGPTTTPAPKPAETVETISVARPRSKAVRKQAQVVQAKSKPAPPVAATSDTPTGFQSLMYCDQLSCSGAMDIIRVQLPASAMNRISAGRPANSMVQADVVVGSDGVARAIRIVQ